MLSKMMQKILVKLHIHCDKCRTKALNIAATAPGVNKVSIEGDHMEVIGNGVDSVCLTRALRKKLGLANIIKVEQVGESTATTEEENPTPIQYYTSTSSYSHFQHPPIVCPMYYHEPTDNCSIM